MTLKKMFPAKEYQPQPHKTKGNFLTAIWSSHLPDPQQIPFPSCGYHTTNSAESRKQAERMTHRLQNHAIKPIPTVFHKTGGTALESSRASARHRATTRHVSSG
jgi:hypothetical protein